MLMERNLIMAGGKFNVIINYTEQPAEDPAGHGSNARKGWIVRLLSYLARFFWGLLKAK
jgi:hypothetical protein